MLIILERETREKEEQTKFYFVIQWIKSKNEWNWRDIGKPYMAKRHARLLLAKLDQGSHGPVWI